MKAHGIAPNAASVKASPAARNFKTERKESSTPVKKRKMDDFVNDHGAAADDDENFDSIKADPGHQGEQLHVKEEPGQMHNGMSENHMNFMPSLSGGSLDYLPADSVFQQNPVGSNTHTTHNHEGNIYGLPDEANFLPFNSFEQTGANDSGQAGSQTGDHHQESILITD